MQRGRGPQHAIDKVADHLKANPGRWAKLVENQRSSTAWRWRKTHEPKGFEIENRQLRRGDKESYAVYVRYVGLTKS